MSLIVVGKQRHSNQNRLPYQGRADIFPPCASISIQCPAASVIEPEAVSGHNYLAVSEHPVSGAVLSRMEACAT